MTDEIKKFLSSDLSKMTRQPRSMAEMSRRWLGWLLAVFTVLWWIVPLSVHGFLKLPMTFEFVLAPVLVLMGLFGTWFLARQMLPPAAAFVSVALLTTSPLLTGYAEHLSLPLIEFAIFPWILGGIYKLYARRKNPVYLLLSLLLILSATVLSPGVSAPLSSLFLSLALITLVLFPFLFALKHSHPIASHNKYWLLWTALLPLLIVALQAFFFKRSGQLLQPILWSQLGIVILTLWRPILDLSCLRRFGILLLFTQLLLVCLFNHHQIGIY